MRSQFLNSQPLFFYEAYFVLLFEVKQIFEETLINFQIGKHDFPVFFTPIISFVNLIIYFWLKLLSQLNVLC